MGSDMFGRRVVANCANANNAIAVHMLMFAGERRDPVPLWLPARSSASHTVPRPGMLGSVASVAYPSALGSIGSASIMFRSALPEGSADG